MAITSYILILCLLSGTVYIGFNMTKTYSPENFCTLYNQGVPKSPCSFVRCGLKEGIPDIGDIDPTEISFLLLHPT